MALYSQQLPELSADESLELFGALVEYAKKNEVDNWAPAYLTLLAQTNVEFTSEWPKQANLTSVAELYQLTPADHSLRNHLLAIIARMNSTESTQQWVDFICNQAPQTSEGINFAFQKFLLPDSLLSTDMLKNLIDNATGNIHIAAAVYDLANHAVRTEQVDSHPAEHRRDQLCDLLGALVQKLAQIEEGNLPAGETPATIANTISNAVSLIVALTDTFALLREERAIPKLRQAAELRHRRIQIEAAAALALMNDSWGKQKLIDCAAEPSVRQRAIAYAKELGFEKDISLEYTGPIATAESMLALWLSAPQQMGLAPTEMKLVEQRKLYWPGYEDQQECFLFEYRYGKAEQSHANIGISGPAIHAFSADLTGLCVEDQYAAFAGWQTLSDEIYLVPMQRARQVLAARTDRLNSLLSEQEFEDLETLAVISFFGNHAIVAQGTDQGTPGTIILDEESVEFIGEQNSAAPIDWRTALDIWKGRRLLSSFNPAFLP